MSWHPRPRPKWKCLKCGKLFVANTWGERESQIFQHVMYEHKPDEDGEIIQWW